MSLLTPPAPTRFQRRVVFACLAAATMPIAALPIVVREYKNGLPGVHATNPDIKLGLAPDPTDRDRSVLVVNYPAPTADPAARDIWLDSETANWTQARTIEFRIKSDSATRLSLSFLDRNGVAYTAWTNVEPGEWRAVQLPFAEIRPNPSFQPPGAKVGASMDISRVERLGFAPQGRTSGRLAISRILLTTP